MSFGTLRWRFYDRPTCPAPGEAQPMQTQELAHAQPAAANNGTRIKTIVAKNWNTQWTENK